MPDPSVSQSTSSAKTRLIGLAMAAGGALMEYYFVFRPLFRARSGVTDDISMPTKLIILAPGAVLAGLYVLLIAPPGINGPMKDAESKTGHIVLIVLLMIGAAIGVGIYFWMRSQLTALGFTDQR